VDSSPPTESFRDLLLRARARAGLMQRDLAASLGVHRRTVQDWETGASHPTAARLQALIMALVEAGALTVGSEVAEARHLWAAVLRESPRMNSPLDEAWLVSLAGAAPARATDVGRELSPVAPADRVIEAGAVERRQDWGVAPDVLGFIDRVEEMARLRDWVLNAHCRLVAILGIGGIGKTMFAARLAREVASDFQRVYWRSLRDALPLDEWLAGAIRFLSAEQLVLPEGEVSRVEVLLGLLRQRPSLLVLDNFETLLKPGDPDGRYRDGYAGYGRLLEAIGGRSHRGCLLVTSRESPPEFSILDGSAARTLHLGGLGVAESRLLLAGKGLSGNPDDWTSLVTHFGGNGLALKVVGESIRELFRGELGAFLNETGSSTVFGGIRRVLADQLGRSSVVEQNVLRHLAVEREPVRLAGLLVALGPRVGRGAVLEAVEALRRRSLVERAEAPGAAAFTLQSVVLEYVTDRLVAAVVDEIQGGQPLPLVDQPLIKALAKDYVRQTQERLIAVPILQQLTQHDGEGRTEQRLLAKLDTWRGRPPAEQSHGPGNVVNLLRLLRGDLRGLDLSRLAIRQAYLAEVDAQDASLAGAHLAETVLAQAFHFPASVALTADGELVAAGTSAGEVWLWRVADRTPLVKVQGHTDGVFGVALSTDGHLAASGGGDGTVRLWETSSGLPLATLEGHAGTVWGVALSADGNLVASGSADGTVRLWETSSGRLRATWQGHTGGVFGVALSADADLVASGGGDGTVRLWESTTGRPLATLQGHTGTVWGVALSADGHVVASGGGDGTVRLWESRTGRSLATLHGHATGGVWRVALSADGQLVVSGGGDGTVRLWETSSGRPLATLEGHTGAVFGVALPADGHLVASGSGDGTVRLWETSTARPLTTIRGHTGAAFAVALPADGHLVASSGGDGTVRLWESPFAEGDAAERWTGRRANVGHSTARPPSAASGGRPLATLQGHTGTVWAVALSADGQLVASGGGDGAVRLWESTTGRPLATLQGHRGTIRGVALSADGRLLVSGGGDGAVRLWESAAPQSEWRPRATLEGHQGEVFSVALSADGDLVASGGGDGTVRLWDAGNGRRLATLEGHSGDVYGVALSADGRLLVSGGGDGTVRLWESNGGRALATLEGHTGVVWEVALSADGHVVASGGGDGAVRLWEPNGGRALATLQGHTGVVWGVALSADGQLVVSAGSDGTVRLWDASTGTWLRTLQAEPRYDRLDITGLTGITEAQRAALLALGAVEHRTAANSLTA